jgi:hypothetical protein
MNRTVRAWVLTLCIGSGAAVAPGLALGTGSLGAMTDAARPRRTRLGPR